MKSSTLRTISSLAIICLLLSAYSEAMAQKYPERRIIRSGNKQYDAKNYVTAEEKYKASLAKMPLSFEGAFNLSDALYRQEKYDQATALLQTLSENESLTPEQRAKVFYNLGNSMVKQQKLQEAADYYKESLRNNPSDMEAKHNLAYVQKMMQEQEQEQEKDKNKDKDKDQDDQNKDQDKDQDKQNQNDQSKENQNKDQQNQDNKNESGDSKENQPEKPKPDKNNGQDEGDNGKINRDNAENILNAIQQQEDNTREKVNQQKTISVGRSGKNW